MTSDDIHVWLHTSSLQISENNTVLQTGYSLWYHNLCKLFIKRNEKHQFKHRDGRDYSNTHTHPCTLACRHTHAQTHTHTRMHTCTHTHKHTVMARFE